MFLPYNSTLSAFSGEELRTRVARKNRAPLLVAKSPVGKSTKTYFYTNYVFVFFCNSVYQVGLLDLDRAFPKRNITVLDQAYAMPKASLPDGYFPALSPDVDSLNVECYVHSEDDLPKPEEDEEELLNPDEQTATEPAESEQQEGGLSGWISGLFH